MLIAVLSIFIAGLDQLIKYFVEGYMYGKEIIIVNKIFSFTYVQNQGAAWGVLSNYSFILKFITPLLIAVITWYIYTISDSKFEKFAGSLVIGGATGNYIDRLFRGYVVDFVDFKMWPVFNFADICIVLGCIIMLICLLKKGNK